MSEIKGICELDIKLKEISFLFLDMSNIISDYFQKRMSADGEEFEAYVKRGRLLLPRILQARLSKLEFHTFEFIKLVKKQQFFEQKKNNIIKGPWL